MWRFLQLIVPKSKVSQVRRLPRCFYATAGPQSGKGKKTLIAVVAITGVGVGVTVAYGKYDPKFRKIIEDNIPYSDLIFKSLPEWQPPTSPEPKYPIVSDQKVRDAAIESGLLKKKQERQKKEEKPIQTAESVPPDSARQQEDKSKSVPAISAKPASVADKQPKPSVIESKKPVIDELSVIENSVKILMAKLEKSAKEAVYAEEAAVEAIKLHTEKLYKALDAPEDLVTQETWKQADIAGSKETYALKVANQKVSDARSVLEKLKLEIQKYSENSGSSKSSIVYAGDETVNKIEKQLKEAEAKVAAAKIKSQTAEEYKDLVKKASDKFKNELKIVLPKYVHRSKDDVLTEDEQNLLIAHAHRRIENLQKELAKQQVTERYRIEEAVQLQKIDDEKAIDSRISIAVAKQQKKLEGNFQEHLDVIRDEFEADMRQQLRRQAAAHADHLQEALHVQHQELGRRHSLELEDKLLQQKGVFISQISESMSRLKAIEAYLKARAQMDESAQKAQALWLACQAMKNTIRSGFSNVPKPLGKELAVVKAAAGEESTFVATVLAGIPAEAVHRGIYTDEYLKQRFDKVKRICRRVAMIDDQHRSLYQYLVSYLQSFFIIDSAHIPKEEIDGKVAVDPSEWDTFDILSRVSYCLQRNDFEQALRYANQLRGEPRNVARDWISEVQLLLETAQAVDCLIAYAAAVGVQAYH